ncbi:putative reverse transcriptase domain-containing protein [Tanacetum coccineum]
MCSRMFPEGSDEVKKYVGGLPDMIQGSVMASKLKTMQDAIEFATELMDKKICTFDDCQAENRRKLDDNRRNNQNQLQPFKKQNAARAYTARPGVLWLHAFSSLTDIIPTALDHDYDVKLADEKIIGVNTIIRGFTLNFLNHSFNIELMPIEIGSFDVIISMDWLAKYHAIIVYNEKIVRIPFGNEILIVHGDESNNGHESQLNIIYTAPKLKPIMASKKGLGLFFSCRDHLKAHKTQS